MDSVRQAARQIFKDVEPGRDADTLFNRVVEQVRLGAEDVGVRISYKDVKDLARQMFDDVHPSVAPEYLDQVIQEMRWGAQEAGMPVYSNVAVIKTFTVSEIAQHVLECSIDELIYGVNEDGEGAIFDEGDVYFLCNNPIPLDVVHAAVPELDEIVYNRAKNEDSSQLTSEDRLLDAIGSVSQDIWENLLTPEQRKALQDLAVARIREMQAQ